MTDLFGNPDPDPQPDPYAGLGQDALRTLRQKDLIDRGIHPATRRTLADNGKTCGDCAHLIVKEGAQWSGRWLKCTETLKGGQGPDMRRWWPACSTFEEIQARTTPHSPNTEGA